MWVEYTAKRSLSSGHSVDVVYQLDFNIIAVNKKTEHRRNVNESLNGTRETIYNTTIKGYTITIGWIHIDDLDLYEEWLDSVVSGEVFTLDTDYGATYAAQVNPVSVKLVTENYSFSMIDNPVGDYYSVDIEVVLV